MPAVFPEYRFVPDVAEEPVVPPPAEPSKIFTVLVHVVGHVPVAARQNIPNGDSWKYALVFGVT